MEMAPTAVGGYSGMERPDQRSASARTGAFTPDASQEQATTVGGTLYCFSIIPLLFLYSSSILPLFFLYSSSILPLFFL
jgi:hypothetical protein